MDERTVIDWADAAWLNPPLSAEPDGEALLEREPDR
jgi:hypothetical protein